jgi:hypothetical protein
MVFGRSATNSTSRGYLYGAVDAGDDERVDVAPDGAVRTISRQTERSPRADGGHRRYDVHGVSPVLGEVQVGSAEDVERPAYLDDLAAGHRDHDHASIAHRRLLSSDRTRGLLEEDAASAATALLALATCLGKLHAATRNHSAHFESLCHDLSPDAGLVAWTGVEFHERIKLLQAGLERLAVRSEAAFLQELETVSGAVERPGLFFTYIHGDPFPDNVFVSGEQVRLIDFEFGRFGHALIDATYGRMMFPTCWCANRLPQGLISRMESAYRAELVKGCPEAEDDSVFETALVGVCAFWLLNSLGWQLQGALREDRTWGIATVRSRLLARLETFLAIAGERGQLPAVRGMAERLLEVLRERWPEAPPLPLYPAFERG